MRMILVFSPELSFFCLYGKQDIDNEQDDLDTMREYRLYNLYYMVLNKTLRILPGEFTTCI